MSWSWFSWQIILSISETSGKEWQSQSTPDHMNYPDASVVNDQNEEKEAALLFNEYLLNENFSNLYLPLPLWDSGYHITTLLINRSVQNEPRVTWVLEWIIFLVKRTRKNEQSCTDPRLGEKSMFWGKDGVCLGQTVSRKGKWESWGSAPDILHA